MSPSPLRATLSFLLAAGVFAGGLSLLLPGAAEEVLAEDFFLETQEVSISAPLRIALPAGFENATAEISPALAGDWKKEGEELVFQPEGKWPLGKAFFAEVAAGKKSFRVELEVVEDPRVVAIFPEGKEVAADGDGVTILFNRALAPLTTFEKGILSTERAPILLPRIAGNWRWLSTRALRFSPAEGRLPRSEEFSLKIPAEISLPFAGVALAGGNFESSFATERIRWLGRGNEKVKMKNEKEREAEDSKEISGQAVGDADLRPLRGPVEKQEGTFAALVEISSLQIPFNAPISLSFSQPFDLQKTLAGLRLLDAAGEEFPFRASFGKGENESAPRREVLEISPAASGNWPLESRFRLELPRVFPAEGSLILDEPIVLNIETTGILAGISARSERSRFAASDFFDPQGELELSFLEEIDLAKSRLAGRKLFSAEHAKRCVDGEFLPGCRQEEDRRRVVLKLDPDFAPGEMAEIFFEKLALANGEEVSPLPAPLEIRAFPPAKILAGKFFPPRYSAETSQLVLCSTTPLAGEEDLEKAFNLTPRGGKIDGFWTRQLSKNKTRQEDSPDFFCGGKTPFQTTINLLLASEKDFAIEPRLKDDFGQEARGEKLSFTAPVAKRIGRLNPLFLSPLTTTPEETLLSFSAENLSEVDITVCQLSPEKFIELKIFPPEERKKFPPADCQRVQKGKVELSEEWWQRDLFEVELADFFPAPRGHFLVEFSGEELRRSWGKEESFFPKVLAEVTDLAVVAKKVESAASRERSLASPSSESSSTGKLARLLDSSSAQPDLISRDAASPDLNPSNFQHPKSKIQLLWVSKFSDLSPVAGAEIETLVCAEKSQAPRFLDLTKTDADGLAFPSAEPREKERICGWIVRAGRDSAVISSGWEDSLLSAGSAESRARAFLSTERKIFRPGEVAKVFGFLREGLGINLRAPVASPLLLRARGPAGVKLEKKVFPEEDGSFSAELEIPEDSALGEFWVSLFQEGERKEKNPSPSQGEARRGFAEELETGAVSLRQEPSPVPSLKGRGSLPTAIFETTFQIPTPNTQFQVADFRPAEFSAKLTPAAGEITAGDSLKLGVAAETFLGAPITGGTATLRAEAEPFFFAPPAGEEELAGFSWQENSIFPLRGGWLPFPVSERLPFEEKLDLDTAGRGEFSLPSLPTAKSQKPTSRKISFTTEVRDFRGESFATEASVIEHAGEFYLGLRAPFAPRAGEEILLETRTLDPAGRPLRVEGLAAQLFLNNGEEPAEKFSFSTSAAGEFSRRISLAEPGFYLLRAEGKDSRGNRVASSVSFFLRGERSAGRAFASREELKLRAESSNLAAGETARVAVENPLVGKTRALLTLEREGIFSTETRELAGDFLFEFETSEELFPRIAPTAVLLGRDSEGLPRILAGSTEVEIAAPTRELSLKILPKKEELRPGEEAELALELKNFEGEPAKGTAFVWVTEEASRAREKQVVGDADLRPLRGPETATTPLLDFFFGSLRRAVSSFGNAPDFLKPEEEEEEVFKNIFSKKLLRGAPEMMQDSAVSFAGMGGGDFSEGGDESPRKDFRKTAFFARVEISETGRAELSFPLPENLGTWRVEALAVDEETRAAATATSLLSRKPLSVSLSAPRFLRPGDAPQLGGVVTNFTGAPQEVTAKLLAPGLFVGEKIAQLSLPAGAAQEILFPVEIPLTQKEAPQLIFSAFSAEAADAAEISLPVLLPTFEEGTATAGILKKDSTLAAEKLFLPEEASLEIEVTRDFAAFREKLKEEILAEEGEGTAIFLEKIRAGAAELLPDLLKRQGPGGGFFPFEQEGRWQPSENFALTARIFRELGEVKTQDFASLRAEAWEKGKGFLLRDWEREEEENPSPFQGEARRGSAEDSETSVVSLRQKPSPDPSLKGRGELAPALVQNPSKIQNPKSKIQLAALFPEESSLLLAGLAKEDLENLSAARLLDLASLGEKNPFPAETSLLLKKKLRVDARGASFPADGNAGALGNSAALLRFVAGGEGKNFFPAEELGNLVRWLRRAAESPAARLSLKTKGDLLAAFEDLANDIIPTDKEESLSQSDSDSSTEGNSSRKEKGSLGFPLDSAALRSGSARDDAAVSNPSKIQNPTPKTQLSLGKTLLDAAAEIPFFKTLRGEDLPAGATTFSLKKIPADSPARLFFSLLLRRPVKAEELPPRDAGLLLEREFFPLAGDAAVQNARRGEVLRGKLRLFSPVERLGVEVKVPLPAGAELVDTSLGGESAAFLPEKIPGLFPAPRFLPFQSGPRKELRDSELFLSWERLPAGETEVEFFLRARNPGKFSLLPATAVETSFPENFGSSAGGSFEISSSLAR
jgi:hypothetical protein